MEKLLTLYRGLNVRLGGAAVFDQAVVGGTNFLTAIFVGRFCGAAEFGLFALATTIWMLVLAFLESLITSPFTVFVHRLREDKQTSYAGSAVVHVLGLASIACLILTVTSAVLYAVGFKPLAVVVLALALTTPFRLLRQFARRFQYASLNLTGALILDIGIAAVQLSALAVFYWLGLLSAASTFLAVGAAYFVVLLFWAGKQRRLFKFSKHRVFPDFIKNWALGRWLAASQISMIVAANILPWIIAIALNEFQTGLYSAFVTLVCIGSPLLVAVQNVLAPRSAAAFAETGIDGLQRVVKRATTGLALGMGFFVVLLAVGGDQLVRLFFGAEYGGFQSVVTLLALCELTNALMLGAAAGLTVLERSDLLFRSNLVKFVATFTLAILFVEEYGLIGAAISQLTGTVLGSLIAVSCYRRVVQQRKNDKPNDLASKDATSPMNSQTMVASSDSM